MESNTCVQRCVCGDVAEAGYSKTGSEMELNEINAEGTMANYAEDKAQTIFSKYYRVSIKLTLSGSMTCLFLHQSFKDTSYAKHKSHEMGTRITPLCLEVADLAVCMASILRMISVSVRF